MFRRLVFENTAALFTFAAFLTAVSIYLAVTWRALRMKRPQVERFENLPFETETPASVGSATGPGATGFPATGSVAFLAPRGDRSTP
jgi:hypothetical protein